MVYYRVCSFAGHRIDRLSVAACLSTAERATAAGGSDSIRENGRAISVVDKRQSKSFLSVRAVTIFRTTDGSPQA